MKRLILVGLLAVSTLNLTGCVAYAPPYGHPGVYYNSAPYGVYGYPYHAYGGIRVMPGFYGSFRGHGWGGGFGRHYH
jgi:hypothetical protein